MEFYPESAIYLGADWVGDSNFNQRYNHLVALESVFGNWSVMKVRISHFTSKNIPINKHTSAYRPVTTKIEAVTSTKIEKAIIPKQTLKVTAREFVKSEIQYASIPKKPSSKLLEFVIQRDAAEFRGIINKSKDVQHNGETENRTKTDTRIVDSHM